MKATVYYIELTRAQVDELNDQGWDSQIGKAYMNAKAGMIDATNFDLLVKAATVVCAPGAEAIWVAMQNGQESWTTLNPAYITCHTAFPRSMDVGDIIIWEDGTRERCASTGFETIEV